MLIISFLASYLSLKGVLVAGPIKENDMFVEMRHIFRLKSAPLHLFGTSTLFPLLTCLIGHSVRLVDLRLGQDHCSVLVQDALEPIAMRIRLAKVLLVLIALLPLHVLLPTSTSSSPQ